MSVINEALQKLEDERSKRARLDFAGEYLEAPLLEAPSSSASGRLLWMVLGGSVVGGVVWIWTVTGGQWSLPVVTFVPPPAIVATVPVVEPAEPVVTLPVPAEVPSVVESVTPLPASADGRSVSGPVVTLPVAALAASVAEPVVSTPVPPPVLPWLAPVWVRSAASLMRHGDRAGALQGWSQGLAKLSPKDAVIVLPPSVTNTAAVALYRRLSVQYPALLVQDNGLLRVLLVPDVAELSDVLADLRTYLKRRTLMATTVAAWRAEQDVVKVTPPAAPVALPVAAVTSTVQTASALVASESVSGVQGTANSSAAEILRRFTAVERMLSQGQFDAALTTVGQVEAEVGETWQTSYLKGTAAQGLRRWDVAIQALTKAHQLNPTSMKVLLNRAICLQEMGKHEQALLDLRQAIVLSPTTPELVANSAYSLDALGRPADALVQYQKFLEMTSGRDDYAKLRAWASKRVAR